MKIHSFTRDHWEKHWDAVEALLIDQLGVNDQTALASMRCDTPIVAVDDGKLVGYANFRDGELEVYTRDSSVAAALADRIRELHPDSRLKRICTLSGQFRSRLPCLTKEFAGRWSEFV